MKDGWVHEGVLNHFFMFLIFFVFFSKPRKVGKMNPGKQAGSGGSEVADDPAPISLSDFSWV